MTRTTRNAVVLVLLVASAGCGGKTETQGETGPSAASPYDTGPRAGESPVAPFLAAQGESLFKAKGCTACHAFGKRLTGPDLAGVTQRRTAQWMEQQILHPEVMTKQDPIAKELLAKYMVQMSNQALKAEEARAVIEYLKQLDEKALEAQPVQAQK